MSPDVEEPPPADQRTRISVRDNAAASRFEAVLDEEVVGILLYERPPGTIKLVHTVTDPEHRHEGAASVLVRTAMAESRAQDLDVVVICPFIESWLKRHPEQSGNIVID